jgi:hypothetical protein
MSKKTYLAVVLSAVVLGGCSSSPSDQVVAMEEAKQNAAKLHLEMEQEKREQELNLLPDWVLEPPVTDATGIYGVGIAESKSLSHGMKSARLQAEFQLAKNYKQELSGSERSFEQGDSEGNVVTQTTFLIDKIVDAVPVIGYEVVEQIAKPLNGKHNVYVLLKLPFEEFNKVLQQQKASTIDSKVQRSFDDLERRLDKRRAQKLQEETERANLEQEALKTRADLLKADKSDAKNVQDQGMKLDN